jgi:uncharacterized protein YggE
MPTVAVYVKAEDAREIEAQESTAIEEWVRGLVARAIEKRKEQK